MARIEPRHGHFDTEVLQRYRAEYEDLVSRGIPPLVTLHHFSHPVWLEDAGAFTREENVPLFNRGVEDSFVLGKFSAFLGIPKTPITPGVYADAMGINAHSRTAATSVRSTSCRFG